MGPPQRSTCSARARLIETLEDGGNAVDAVVAAAAVLGVTEPYSCGIGGGGFMTIRTPDGKVTTIDSREESPAAMEPGLVLQRTAPRCAFEPARWSGLSAGVPGTVAGWERALRRYGTQSLARTLRPGIEVAREGFTVDQTFVDQTTPAVGLLRRHPLDRRALPGRGRNRAATSATRSATATSRARTG